MDMAFGERGKSRRLMLLADAVPRVGHWCLFDDLQQIVLLPQLVFIVMQLACWLIGQQF